MKIKEYKVWDPGLETRNNKRLYIVQNSSTCVGALLWNGDNGTISKCRFINNTAFGVGGAMYVIVLSHMKFD